MLASPEAVNTSNTVLDGLWKSTSMATKVLPTRAWLPPGLDDRPHPSARFRHATALMSAAHWSLVREAPYFARSACKCARRDVMQTPISIRVLFRRVYHRDACDPHASLLRRH